MKVAWKKMMVMCFVLAVAVGVWSEPLNRVLAEASVNTEDGIQYNIDETTLTATVTGYIPPSDDATAVTIPQVITVVGKDYTVTAIGDSAFYAKSYVEEINIPSTVTQIGACAMEGVGCETITIPDSVNTIGYNAFSTCQSLKSVILLGNVESMGSNLFSNCTELTNVSLPEGLTSIPDSMFYGCTSLEQVDIPVSVETIKMYAFYNCISLEKVNIPNGVTSIDMNVFSGCTSLESVNIPNSVTDIGMNAFKGCTSLESVNIPNGVTNIGMNAFSGCTRLKTVKLPNGVTCIGLGAFDGCTSLSSVNIPSTVSEIGTIAFYGCSALENVVIPDSVTTLGGGVFTGCTGLKTFYYPESLSDNDAVTSVESQVKVSYAQGTEENTVRLTIVSFSEDVTELVIPESISGKEVVALEVNEELGDVTLPSVSFDKHEKDAYTYSETDHWIVISCDVCGKTQCNRGTHEYEDGKACVCGYVPFTLSKYTERFNVVYGDTKTAKLSTTVIKTLGKENVTYQWYQNQVAIEGANLATYTLPARMLVGDYQYSCKISCGDYTVETGQISLTVSKRNITVQIDSVERNTGAENPAFTYKIVEGTLAEGDTTEDWKVNLTTNATKDSVAGTYPITGVVTSDCYNITVKDGVLTVKATETPIAHKKGDTIKDSKKIGVYKITKVGTASGKTGTVTYVKPVSKNKKTITIPSTITVDGVTYKVTAIAANALKGNKNVTKVTIGTNVANIGKNAFYKCKKLKTLVMKSKKLTTKKIGKNAFKGISSKATIKVPKKKIKTYKKMLQKRGVGKKAKFKKI